MYALEAAIISRKYWNNDRGYRSNRTKDPRKKTLVEILAVDLLYN
jgi:hypothetical protein